MVAGRGRCWPTAGQFLLGAAPSLADCALYNPVWFLKERLGAGKAVPPLDRLPKIVAWSERMKAFGNGKPTDMTGGRCARRRQGGHSRRRRVSTPTIPAGSRAGQTISVTPDDTGKVPVTGVLVGLTAGPHLDPRSDPRVGDVVVHFPRAGFVVRPVYSEISPFSTGTQPPPTLARMPSAARRAEQASRLGRPISTPCMMS